MGVDFGGVIRLFSKNIAAFIIMVVLGSYKVEE
jgi:hypothetical protein